MSLTEQHNVVDQLFLELHQDEAFLVRHTVDDKGVPADSMSHVTSREADEWLLLAQQASGLPDEFGVFLQLGLGPVSLLPES